MPPTVRYMLDHCAIIAPEHCPRPLSGRGQSPARSVYHCFRFAPRGRCRLAGQALRRPIGAVARQRSGDNPGRNGRGRVPDASPHGATHFP
eukprot:gene23470-biopygen13370